MNNKQVILYTGVKYEVSDFIKNLTETDTELLLEYGENLLKGHHAVINTMSNSQNARYLKEIKAKENELQELKEASINEINKYKESINKMQKQMILDAETENLKTQAFLELERSKYNSEIVRLHADLQTKYVNELEFLKKERDVNKTLYLQARETQECEFIKNRALLESEQNKCIVLYDKINEMQSENLKLIDKYKSEMHDEIKKCRDIDALNLKAQIENEQMHHKFAISQAESYHNNIIAVINERLAAAENALKEKEKCLMDVSKIVKYYDFQDNATKGANGENKTQEIIKSYYNDAIIVDTSGTPHSGDMLVSVSNLKCLIEVKNKKYTTEGDIAKFLNDINGKEINCALFISLISSTPKGNFHIEIKNSMPVVYIYAYDKSAIYFAIETLIFLTNKFINLTKKSRTDQQLSDEIVTLINNTFNTMKYESDRIASIILHLEKQINQLKISKKNLVSRVDDIKNIYNKYEKLEPQRSPQQSVEETKLEYTDEEMKKMRDWMTEKKQIPTRHDIMKILELSTYEINRRGTSELRKKLKTFM
jgi:hypothetical protein